MQQHRLRKSMPLLVKNVVYWIGFEYSNLPHIRIQNQGFFAGEDYYLGPILGTKKQL